MTSPDDRSRLDRPWPDLLLDVVPVVALLALALVISALDRQRLSAPVAVMIVLLVARRRWPPAVLAAVAALAVGTSVDTPGPWIQVATVAFASFTTGERAGDRTRSALTVLLVAALMAGGLLAREAQPLESLVLPFVVLVPSWIVGDVVRSRRIEEDDRLDAAQRAARDAEARLETAVTEERRRMARELHDVVAHAVSVMVIQAGAARQVVRTSPDRAEEALLTVEATGRDAMAELRRMLGVLNDDGEGVGLAPQPGLELLGALVDRVRDAGLPTELRIDGVPRPVPASLDVTIYRIVQEALTNALRYARQASTLVHISYEPEQLRIEVLDDGPGAAAPAADGAGRGLAGMQQRAAGVGGRLEAGPRLGGGYAVRAWLPTGPVQS